MEYLGISTDRLIEKKEIYSEITATTVALNELYLARDNAESIEDYDNVQKSIPIIEVSLLQLKSKLTKLKK